jgi:hypothetical protein
MLRIQEGDEDENFRGDLHPYISVCADIRLPMKEAGLPLDILAAHGCSMMCWRLESRSVRWFTMQAMRGEARFDGALIGYGRVLVFTGRSRKLIPSLG